MKTEKEIKVEIKRLEKKLRKVSNVGGTFQTLPIHLRMRIKILNWVLDEDLI